jgi:hydroxymethylpyrimidine pyrophosphatase-like HAD family hydrolase
VKNNLFLMDLDLTLIDKSYQPTIDILELIDIVQCRKREGDIFGLISDTPYATLKQWMNTFQFNGPVVSEKGILISLPDGSQQVTLDTGINWISIKEKCTETLSRLTPRPSFVQRRYLEVFAEGPVEKKTGDIIIIINPNRQFSFSMHVRRVDGRSFVIDEQLFSEAVECVDKVLMEMGLSDILDVDANPLYSVIILSDKRVVKSLAMPFLRQSYPDHRLIMIGDGNSDAELKGHVDVLCAVGNASIDLKKAADRIATKTITSGVLELLEQLKE